MIQTTIAPGHWLDAPAAASYGRMRAAGMPAGVTSAGRTAAEQQRLRDLYLAGQGSFALPPEKSLHVAGLALDLPGHISDPSTPRGWIRTHGFNHGWTPVANEPWHHEYTPTLDTHQEDDMTPEQAKQLQQLAADAAWLKKRIGGSLSTHPALSDDLTWVKKRIGGSLSTHPALATALDDIDAGPEVDIDSIVEKLTATLSADVVAEIAKRLTSGAS